MARKKTAEAEAPDVFDEAIAAQQVPVAEPIQENGHSNGHTNGHAEKVRHQTVKHSENSYSAGDLRIHYLDTHNDKDGVAILVTTTGRELTSEEKKVISGVMRAPTKTGYDSPFDFEKDFNPPVWLAEIGKDSHPKRTLAIKLDGESRAKKLAEALKQHQADPVGYREQVQRERAQAAEAQR